MAAATMMAGAVAGAVTPVDARAATVPWTNGAGGNFNDIANWNAGAGPVPGLPDTAQFNLAQTYTTTFPTSPNIGALAVSAGDVTFRTDGFAPRTLTMSSATFSGGILTLGPAPVVPVPVVAPMALSINNAFSVQDGAQLRITAGNDVISSNWGLTLGTVVTNGILGAVSAVAVDGTGSSLNSISSLSIGNSSAVGSLTLTNNATASFRGVFTGSSTSPFSGARITVASGADLTIGNGFAGNGYAQFATGGGHANQVNFLTVTGAGSTLNQDGGWFTIGGGVAPFVVTVADGASLTTSTGGYRLDVHANATIDYTGGTLNLRGDLNIDNGGIVKQTAASGALNWPDGLKRITVSSGGKFDVAGPINLNAASSSFAVPMSVAGANSKLAVGGELTVADRVSVNVGAGGSLSAGTLAIAGPTFEFQHPTVSVDGAGATLSAGAVNLGGTLKGSRLSFKNNASGTITGPTTFLTGGGHNALLVESGADVTAGNIVMGALGSPSSGSITVSNAGSTLTQSGAATLAMHNSHQITVNSGGAFTTGTGGITLTSDTSINANGGTFIANGDISITQGSLSGLTSWAAGRTATVTTSGHLSAPGDLLGLAGNTINVSNSASFSARNVVLSDSATVSGTTSAFIQFRSMQLGTDGSAVNFSVSGAGSRLNLIGTAHTSTIGAAAGLPVSVQILNNAQFTAPSGSTVTVRQTGTLTVSDTTGVRLGGLRFEGGQANFSDSTVLTGALLDVTGGSRVVMHGDAKLIVRGGAVGTSNGTTYDGVSGLIQSGYNDGTWSGPGIATDMSDAAAGLTSLGIAAAEQVGYAGGTFGGVSVATGDALVMYTYAGDANLDGFISGDDYAAIDFNMAVPGASGWHRGDFNYDGVLSGDDYTVIDFNVVAQGTPFPTSPVFAGVTTVPEPGGGVAVVGALVALFKRRQRGG